jgi:DNA-binding LacI/PurR family transcriptional regulator
MSRAHKKATIADVAKLCNVSTATVSRVLNSSGSTRESLRLQIEGAAKELGYVYPKKLAYKHDKTSVVLVLTPDLLNPYFTEIIKVIQDSVSREDLICFSIEARNIAHVSRTLNMVNAQLIRGLILFDGILTNQEVVALVNRSPFPIVIINQIIENTDVLCINIDYARATYQGTIHLLELGHQDFAFIGGRRGSDTGQEKIRGILNALGEKGLAIPDSNIMFGTATTDWGFQAALTLLRNNTGRVPTAIICSCDLIALGALHAIRSLQYSVPQSFSVLGFDDISMACHADPPLTTISPPKERIGKLAVSLITAHAAKPEPNVSNYIVFDSPLIVRSSTGRRNPASG